MLTALFDYSELTPHGFCLAWEPGLIWLHAISDDLVALSYYSIPLTLLYFARKRRDMIFPSLFFLFAAFILACGTTHIMAMVTLWYPLYWLDGVIKAITAALSIITAIMLWPLMPKALAVPSPAQLQAVNMELSQQICEREAITAELHHNERRLKALYIRTPAVLHALDMDGRLVEVSDRWLDMFGYTRADVMGKCVTNFYTDEFVPKFHQDWSQVLQQGELKDCERRMRCKNGDLRDLLISGVLERDEDNQPFRIVAACTDVTARKQAESALLSSEEQLRQAQKMEAVGQLTGGIAHDFNNMLTIVMGSMELLQRRLAADEALKHLVSTAMQSAERAARLTNQLLSFSRKQRLVPKALAPHEVADNMSVLLRRTLGEQIDMVISPLTEQQWHCLADRNQLESALLNLVLNAKAAIATEGIVTISIGNHIMHADDIATLPRSGDEPLQSGEYVSISVSDNGSGMAETVRQRAFEPFFTTKPLGKGSGLGLSQIYGFARQSGGTVWIDSTPGRGTSVTLYLPRALPMTEADLPVHTNLPLGQGETILLAEDEPDLREIASSALEEIGYHVITASDAASALTIVQQGVPIHMLFTDIMMPGHQNGVDLAIEIRKILPDLPVMFATGYSDRSVLAHWPGPINLMAKPYSMAELVRNAADTLATRAP